MWLGAEACDPLTDSSCVQVGTVTSGSPSPSLGNKWALTSQDDRCTSLPRFCNRLIAMGYIKDSLSAPGTQVRLCPVSGCAQ